MEIIFILLVFLSATIMAYALPVQIEDIAEELNLDYETLESIYKTMSLKQEKRFIYKGMKHFIFKRFYKDYKVDPHKTVLTSVFFLNYYFYITFPLVLLLIIFEIINLLPSSSVFAITVVYFILTLLIYESFVLYYKILAKIINGSDMRRFKEDIKFEYYIKHENYDLTSIYKDYSNIPFDAIKEMIIAFNYAVSLEEQIAIIDKLYSLIEYYDPILFQKQLKEKYIKLFDYSLDPIVYLNNAKKFYDLLLKTVFTKKKDKKEISYFLSLLSYSITYEIKIYSLEKKISVKMLEDESFDVVYKIFKNLDELVKKQVVLNKLKNELQIRTKKFSKEEEYYKELVEYLCRDTNKAKKNLKLFFIISGTVFLIIMLVLLLTKNFNLILISIFFVLEFLAVLIYALYQKTKVFPYFNLYVPMTKEKMLKYNFLGKYIDTKNEKVEN